MDPIDLRQAANALRDAMLEPRRPLWPKLLALLLVAGGLAGGAYWYIQSHGGRFEAAKFRAESAALAKRLLNEPVLRSAPAASAPSPEVGSAPSKDDAGLLSN